MASKTIATILTLKDNMSGGILKASRNVQGMSREMRRATNEATRMSSNFTSGIDKMTTKVLKFGALAAIGGAGLVLKVGLDGLKELDEASSKVKSIALDALKLEDIKNGLLKTSNKTGISVTELGDTQYNAISSGVKPNESLAAAVTSAKLAKAGFTDANSALKVLTSTMNVYGLQGQTAMQSISDKMLVVQNLGVTTVAEMAEHMGSVTPIAQAAGASVDELDAAMISLTKNGIKTDEAVTELKGIFTSIIAPTKESADMAESLGLEFNASALKSKGFVKFMEDVKTKTGGSTEKMAGLFGNVRALTGSLVLTGAGFKDFNSGLSEVQNSAGMTDKAFKIMENTLGNKIKKTKNIFHNTCTSIAKTQSGALGELMDGLCGWLTDNEKNIQGWVNSIGVGITKIIAEIKRVVDFVIKYKTAVINFALAFGSFALAIKLTKGLAFAIDSFKVAWVILNGAVSVSFLGWVLIGLTALTIGFVLLYKNSSKFREGVAVCLTKLQEFGNYIITNIMPALISVGNTIKSNVMQSFNFLAPIVTNFTTNILVPLVNFLVNVFQVAFSVVFPFISSVVTNVFNTIIAGVQGGIQVFGGLLEFITGVFTGNWSQAWEGVKNIFGGIFGSLGAIAKGAMNGIIATINLAINGINKLAGFKLPKALGGGHIGVEIPNIPEFALGTPYTTSGLVRQNERGGELAIHPNGTAIIPADKTDKLLNGTGKSININMYIDSFIGEEYFADQIGERIASKVKLALCNM